MGKDQIEHPSSLLQSLQKVHKEEFEIDQTGE